VEPANDLAASLTGTTADTKFVTLNTAVKNALEGLPNDVLSDITVESGFCDYVVPGECDLGDSTGLITDVLTTTTDSILSDADDSYFYRAPGSTTFTLGMASPGTNAESATGTYTTWLDASSLSDYSTPTTPFGIESDPSAATPGTIDANVVSPGGRTCYYIPYAHCVRIAVTFGGNPGDLAELAINLDGLETANRVQAGLSAPVSHSALTVTTIDAGISDTIHIGITGVGFMNNNAFTDEMVWNYVNPSDQLITCDYSDATTACSTGPLTATQTSSIMMGTSEVLGGMFRPYERIRVKCGSLEIGTYTVSDLVRPGADTINTLETMPTCAGTTLATQVTIELVSSFMTTNADVRGRVSVGDVLITSSGVLTPPVSRIEWDVSEEHTQNSGTERYADTAAGTITGTSVATWATDSAQGRIFFETTWAETTSTLNAGLKLYGKGTKEANECSDRGVCDYESGQCTCFGGYTGLACNIQHSLQA